MGYYQQVVGGIYGTPDAGDPVARAELQEQYSELNRLATTHPGYVPPDMAGRNAPMWATQTGGPSSLPIIGWTCQNSTGPAFHPYSTVGIGTTPDWTNDVNPIGAGSYDMNQTWGAMAPNPLNRGPIGDGFFQGMDGQPPNPNHLPQDVGGSIGGFNEY